MLVNLYEVKISFEVDDCDATVTSLTVGLLSSTQRQ